MLSAIEPVASDRHVAGSFARPPVDRGRDGPIGKFLPSHEDAPVAQADRFLRCRACGFAIARDSDRIRVRDTHEHRCINPHGIQFHIGCFRQAPGATEIGKETLEHTWFAGYRWRIMLCAGCTTHVGWGFHGQEGDRFCALILDRLIIPH